MMHARQVLCGLLLFLGAASPGLAQTPGAADRSADACPATLTSVRLKCGCEPREEAVFNSLAQTKVNSDNLRSKVTNCFSLNGQVNVSKVKLGGDAELGGCLLKLEDQYPEYRTTLVELVKATKDVPPRRLDMWLDCYGTVLGGAPKSPRAPATRTGAPGRPSPPGAAAPASSPGIDQQVEAGGHGRVTTGEVEAVHDGKPGPTTIRQSIKASDHGVITTGPIKAHVGP